MDAALLSAGIAAALAVAGFSGSTKSSPRKSGRQGRKVQTRSVNSSGLSGMLPTKGSDLRVKPPDPFSVPTRMPRNIASMLAWDTVKVDGTITTSTTGIVETNFVFSLSNHPQASSWSALFDQYFIFMASVQFDSDLAPGSTTSPARLYTAIDFDNVSNLGSVSALEDFATSEAIVMQPQSRHLRSVLPCSKISVGGTSQVTPQRAFIDCATPGINHYGLRSICSQTTASLPIATTLTIVYCFRNQI